MLHLLSLIRDQPGNADIQGYPLYCNLFTTAQTESASNHNPAPAPGKRRLHLLRTPKRHHNPFRKDVPAAGEPLDRYGQGPYLPQSPKNALTAGYPRKFCVHYSSRRTGPVPGPARGPGRNAPACSGISATAAPPPLRDKSAAAHAKKKHGLHPPQCAKKTLHEHSRFSLCPSNTAMKPPA